MILAPLLAVLVAAVPEVPSMSTGSATPHERPFTVYVGLGVDRGGEKIADIPLTDGSNQTLSANQGGFLAAGLGFLQHRLGATTMVDTLATVGVKGWTAGGSDGSIDYLTFPVEVVERVWLENVRLGAGVSYLIAPRITTDGVLSVWGDADMENAFGFVGQAEWIWHRPGSFQAGAIGVRMVFTELRVKGGGTFDASSWFGLTLGFEL